MMWWMLLIGINSLTYTFMIPLLTLDQSTLFYWTLSDASQKKQKHSSKINEWAATIPATAKPTFQAPRSTSSHAKSGIPSLMSGASHSLAPSVLTDDVKIISYWASNPVKVKAEPVPELSMYDDGGLSDNDEIRGEEQEVTINSPPKGKKRVTSEVSLFSFIQVSYDNLISIPSATRSSKALKVQQNNIKKALKWGASELDWITMVPPYICYNIYGICWSNHWPLGCACQAVSQGDAEDLGWNQHLPVQDYNIHRSLSEGTQLVWLCDDTKIHFRWFNTLLTHGVMLSDPPASPSFSHFSMPKKIYEIQIQNVSNLPSIILRIFAFCTKIPNTTTKRYGSEHSVSII